MSHGIADMQKRLDALHEHTIDHKQHIAEQVEEAEHELAAQVKEADNDSGKPDTGSGNHPFPVR